MLRKTLFVCGLIFTVVQAFCQVMDDFSDGDFSISPQWFGDTANFEVDNNFWLHLNAPAQVDTSFLSTPCTSINNATWEIQVKLDFNPSSSNYANIYLVSDRSNLKEPLNGYFVQLGGSSDEVSLYRQDGMVFTKIIDGTDGVLNTSNVNCGVRVTRDHTGNWQLESDTSMIGNYLIEGNVFDNIHLSSSYFGVSCRYTSTRSTRFFYDDVIVSGLGFIDTVAPMLDSIDVIGSNDLSLYFNEPVDLISSQNLTNYSVDLSIGNPVAVMRDNVDSSIVHLSFSSSFINGQSYNLSITNVADTNSNTLSSITSPFRYLQIASPSIGDVVINELLVDPVPSVGLPDLEFIELFNKSDSIFSLANWQLVNTNTHRALSNFILEPGEFVILCDVNDTSFYSFYGHVLGINSFVALTNNGDSISLLNENGNLIDVVEYEMSWYQDPSKDDGGWSLERINPEQLCNPSSNWKASIDPVGGTPGSQNSIWGINLDNDSPELASAVALNDSVILLTLNEAIDTSIVVTANYHISNGVLIAHVAPLDYKTIRIIMSNKLSFGVLYEVSVSDLMDCVGNLMNENERMSFALPQMVEQGDILINEVLFNPYPGGVDFVEIYNHSDKYIDLLNWKLANLEDDTISNHKAIIEASRLIHPKEFVLLSSNSDIIVQEYLNTETSAMLEMHSLPSYPNDEGFVYLMDSANQVIDNFAYHEDMQFELLTDPEGVSLERINYSRPSNDPTNWHSAAEDVGFATPGFENSQYSSSELHDDEISVNPPIFSPDNDGFDDVTHISYNLSEEGYVATIVIYNKEGRVINTLVQNELLGKSGTYSWDGIDSFGEKVPVGIYIIFVELFNVKGDVKSHKKTVVLAPDL